MTAEPRLQETVKKVERKLAHGAESVPLDQPFPEELADSNELPEETLLETPSVAADAIEIPDEPKVTKNAGTKEVKAAASAANPSVSKPKRKPHKVLVERYERVRNPETRTNTQVMILLGTAAIVALICIFVTIIANIYFALVVVLLGILLVPRGV